jgi:hypothetical protein
MDIPININNTGIMAMKELFYTVLIILGVGAGWLLNQWLNANDENDQSYLSFEQAVKQSKLNLVRDNYAEFFNICEKKTLGSWQALMVAGYQFQYGIDMADIKLRKTSEEGVTPEAWTVDVSSIELSAAELSTMQAFATDKTLFNKYKDKIQQSTESLIPRKRALGLQRLHNPSSNIRPLLRESLAETLSNIANSLATNIQITAVNLPPVPKNWKKGLTFNVKYQCGTINAIFDDRLKSVLPSATKSTNIPPELPLLETYELTPDAV